MSPLERIIDLTNATRSGSSGSYVGHCPIHYDKNKSLSITEKDGKTLVNCFAGCSSEEIINHFKENDAWPVKHPIQKNSLVETLWNSANDLCKDDLATKYLHHRGINLDAFPNTLRFSSNCYYKENGNDSDPTHIPCLLGKIQDETGKIIGVQRIYLSKEGKKASINDPKKILGESSGGYTKFQSNSPSNTIHIVEGIETGLGVYNALKETVYCAISATNLSKVPTAKTVKIIHVWADKDKSGAGQREAKKAALKFRKEGKTVFVHLPNEEIPEDCKSIDFLDVYLKDPALIINEKENGEIYINEIKPIKSPQYDLPAISEFHLPFILRDWVTTQSERINIAPEMIVVPLFSILGSVIGRKIALRPKMHDHWKIYPNLWGIIIAPPGTRKSAALEASVRLLNANEQLEIQKFFERNSTNEIAIEELKIKIKDSEKKHRDALLAEDTKTKDENAQKIIDLKRQLKSLLCSPPRFSTNSFTTEKLIELLGDNSNGLLIYRDELNAIFQQFNKKGQETTRQFLLEGWNGNGSFNYDILSRETKPLHGICLTLLGGTQPSILNSILKEMKHDQNNDGFLQRFQLIAYPNPNLTAGFVDKASPKELDDKVNDLIKGLIHLDPSKHAHNENGVFVTKLDEASYKLFSSYMDSIEKEVSSSEIGDYKSHISKFGNLLSGLILIFHVIDNYETNRSNDHVLSHVVEMAIRWCDLFKAHAKKLYDIELNFEATSGFALAKKIVEGKVSDETSLRTIYRNGWTDLKSDIDVESAAKFLEKHSWLTVTEDKPKTGRPTKFLSFNPALADFLLKGHWYE